MMAKQKIITLNQETTAAALVPLGALVQLAASAAALVEVGSLTFLRTGTLALQTDFPDAPVSSYVGSVPVDPWTQLRLFGTYSGGGYTEVNGRKFYLGGSNSSAFMETTDDGLTWTNIVFTTAFNVQPASLCWNGTIWMVTTTAGKDYVFVSTDMVTWTRLVGVAWNNSSGNIWIARADPSTGRIVVVHTGGYDYAYSTDDAATWGTGTADNSLNRAFHDGFAFHGGVFMSMSYGSCLRSTDGVTWSGTDTVASGLSNEAAGHGSMVVSSTGAVFSISGSGRVLKSTDDGLTWSYVLNVGASMSGMCIVGTKIHVMLASSGLTYSSPDDGLTWEALLCNRTNNKQLHWVVSNTPIRAMFSTGSSDLELAVIGAGGTLPSVYVGSRKVLYADFPEQTKPLHMRVK